MGWIARNKQEIGVALVRSLPVMVAGTVAGICRFFTTDTANAILSKLRLSRCLHLAFEQTRILSSAAGPRPHRLRPARFREGTWQGLSHGSKSSKATSVNDKQS